MWFRHSGPVSRHLSTSPLASHTPQEKIGTVRSLDPVSYLMGHTLFFLTSLRTIVKRNQLVRFRMASTAATVNTVRVSVWSLWIWILALTRLCNLVWAEGPVAYQNPGAYQREVGGRGGRRKDHRDKFLCCSSPCLRHLADHIRLSLTDPANNAEIGTVPEMTLAQTKEAIAAAGNAFKSWSKTTAKVSPSSRCQTAEHLWPVTALSTDTT